MSAILRKHMKHKCDFCNYRSDLKYNMDRHVKRCSEYENNRMHQERPQSSNNIMPSILGKQKKHKCEFCNYSSDRKHDVKRHAGKKHQEIIQSRNKIDKEKLRKSLILMKQEYIQKLKLGEKVFKILEEQNMEQVRLKEAYKEAVNLYIKQRLSIDD